MDHAQLAPLYRAHIGELGRRYAEALAAAGADAVVIHSGSLKKRTLFDDQFWPLRPTPHFHHWLPLSQADCALVVQPGRTPLLLWLKATSFWEKPARPEAELFRDCFEIREIEKIENVKDHFPTGARLAWVGEDVERGAAWGFATDKMNPIELVGPLDRLRARKTPYEVACIVEANRRAALGHQAVLQAFRDGDRSELELHLLFLATTGQDDPETPYKNIVALGANGATLHHVSYVKERQPRACQSLLLDAGATVLGYCSDVTRTWVKGTGAAASAFAQLVAEVEAMQKRLCAQVRVGESYEALHDDAHRQVAEILRAVGISRLSAEEAKAAELSKAFFPHGLGHSLGLQCHDVG